MFTLSLSKKFFLDLSKLKAFVDDKIYLTQNLKFVLERIKNIEEKGENAGDQHFSPFLTMFLKPSFLGLFNPFPNDKFQTLPN